MVFLFFLSFVLGFYVFCWGILSYWCLTYYGLPLCVSGTVSFPLSLMLQRWNPHIFPCFFSCLVAAAFFLCLSLLFSNHCLLFSLPGHLMQFSSSFSDLPLKDSVIPLSIVSFSCFVLRLPPVFHCGCSFFLFRVGVPSSPVSTHASSWCRNSSEKMFDVIFM